MDVVLHESYTSAPARAPGALAKTQVDAIRRLLDFDEISQASGDIWLSDDEVRKVGDIFREDFALAELYLMYTERSMSGESSGTCTWIRNKVLPLARW